MDWNLLFALGGGLLIGYVLGAWMRGRDANTIIAWYSIHLNEASEKIGRLNDLCLKQQETLDACEGTIQELQSIIEAHESYQAQVGEVFDGLLNIPLEKGGESQ